MDRRSFIQWMTTFVAQGPVLLSSWQERSPNLFTYFDGTRNVSVKPEDLLLQFKALADEIVFTANVRGSSQGDVKFDYGSVMSDLRKIFQLDPHPSSPPTLFCHSTTYWTGEESNKLKEDQVLAIANNFYTLCERELDIIANQAKEDLKKKNNAILESDKRHLEEVINNWDIMMEQSPWDKIWRCKRCGCKHIR